MSSKTAGPLTGQVALITGSESGIGRATVRAFCQQGAAVVLNGRQAERLEHDRQALAAEGYPVAACVAGVTDYAAFEHLVAAAVGHFGRLDTLITTASIFMRAYFLATQPEVFRRVLNHHVRRRRTVISALGRLILVVHSLLPRLGDWAVLTSQRRLRNFYE